MTSHFWRVEHAIEFQPLLFIVSKYLLGEADFLVKKLCYLQHTNLWERCLPATFSSWCDLGISSDSINPLWQTPEMSQSNLLHSSREDASVGFLALTYH